MFCPNCGAQTNDDAKFCMSCGAVISTAPQPTTAVAAPQKEFIDLTGQADHNASREKKHIGTVIGGLLIEILRIGIALLIMAICDDIGYPRKSLLLPVPVLFWAPVGVVGLFTKTTVWLQPKVKKPHSIVFDAFSRITPTLGLVWAFAESFFDMRLRQMIRTAWFLITAMVVFAMCNIFANQYGKSCISSEPSIQHIICDGVQPQRYNRNPLWHPDDPQG